MIRSNNYIGCYEPPVENIEKLTNEKPIESYLTQDCTFSTLENRNLRIKLACKTECYRNEFKRNNAFLTDYSATKYKKSTNHSHATFLQG